MLEAQSANDADKADGASPPREELVRRARAELRTKRQRTLIAEIKTHWVEQVRYMQSSCRLSVSKWAQQEHFSEDLEARHAHKSASPSPEEVDIAPYLEAAKFRSRWSGAARSTSGPTKPASHRLQFY